MTHLTPPTLVVIESPYAGDREINDLYLAACIKDSLSRGEAPYASHGFYTQGLDDGDPEERTQGMECGFAWGAAAAVRAVYVDLGVSDGMFTGVRQVTEGTCAGQTLVYRSLLEPGANFCDLIELATRIGVMRDAIPGKREDWITALKAKAGRLERCAEELKTRNTPAGSVVRVPGFGKFCPTHGDSE